MKLYIALFILVSIGCAPAKKIEKQNYPVPFEFVLIDTVNADKNYIYVKAHEWISKTYNSAKTVIDMQDKEAGKLIGKAKITITPSSYSSHGSIAASVVDYIISIDVKDGKYRCIISDFTHEGGMVSYGGLNKEKVMITSASGAKIESKSYYDVKNKSMDMANRLLADLKLQMHKRGDDF